MKGNESMISIIFERLFLKLSNPKSRGKFLRKRMGINIGKKSIIYNNVNFGSEPYLITIGDNVVITNGTQFITHDGGMSVLRNLDLNPDADLFGTITVGNNVFIGYRSLILPGVNIGNNVIIGAGSIVTHDLPENTVCAGVPAKPIRTIDEYFQKNRLIIDNTHSLSSLQKKEYLLKKFK